MKRKNVVMSAFARFKQKQPTMKRKLKSEKKKKFSTPIQNPSNFVNITPRTTNDFSPQARCKARARIADQVSHRQNNPLVAPPGNQEKENCFRWLIKPVSPEVFFRDTFETKPLHIKDRGDYYAGILSCKDFDRILRTHHLEYNKNIDIVTYQNGQRETMDLTGRANAAVVWDFFQNGHTVRLLNPQAFSRPVWKLCSILQEYFGSSFGANMYLTPAGSQGFAPHYDDIEAFVIQLEGAKKWKMYAPRSSNETLPRYSSEDFHRSKIGKPMIEMEVKPGDLLYFPRGFIHEAMASESEHSLHLTLSTFQRNTYGDLLKKILPRALEDAMAGDMGFRQSLPKDYMDFLGSASSNEDNPRKDEFIHHLIELTKRVSNYLMVDTGADMMAKDFIHSSLPPCLSEEERKCSILDNGERWGNNRVCNSVQLTPDTEIAFIRKRAVHLVNEDGKYLLYHSFENSRDYKEREAQSVEIDWDLCEGVKMLLDAYPNYVAVEALPLKNLEQQFDLATLLYDKGIIKTRVPLVADSSADENEE